MNCVGRSDAFNLAGYLAGMRHAQWGCRVSRLPHQNALQSRSYCIRSFTTGCRINNMQQRRYSGSASHAGRPGFESLRAHHSIKRGIPPGPLLNSFQQQPLFVLLQGRAQDRRLISSGMLPVRSRLYIVAFIRLLQIRVCLREQTTVAIRDYARDCCSILNGHPRSGLLGVPQLCISLGSIWRFTRQIVCVCLSNHTRYWQLPANLKM